MKNYFSATPRTRLGRWYGALRRCPSGWVALWLCVGSLRAAIGPDDRFIEIYNLIQTAD